ncbi:UspA [Gossypium australe]|uniref:UspA n=1 Tax=Gossypium australe TaxID=47621 RepID=A0A5B6WUE2_9ROSI|nr:UspA [Gossypium australe]
MASSSSFFRQLSGKQGWKSKSLRWGVKNKNNICGGCETSLKAHQMEGLDMYGNGGAGSGDDALVLRKRVMVLVDKSSHSRHAMMWALTHVANKGDLLTLLHVIPPTPNCSPFPPSFTYLANSLGSLCKACKPEVEVEALIIQGPKLWTVKSQVKKLGVSVLVVGQRRQSPLLTLCLGGSRQNDEFVEQCIKTIDRHCLTIGVRRQSNGLGGYLITTRWLNNFWLLA